MDFDTVCGELSNVRDKITEVNAKLKELKELKQTIEGEILNAMADKNLKSFGLENGVRVTQVLSTKYNVTDWQALNAYIMEHGALGLLQARVSSTAIASEMEISGSVPGVEELKVAGLRFSGLKGAKNVERSDEHQGFAEG